jgi:hypothetical protein
LILTEEVLFFAEEALFFAEEALLFLTRRVIPPALSSFALEIETYRVLAQLAQKTTYLHTKLHALFFFDFICIQYNLITACNFFDYLHYVNTFFF